MSDKFFPDVSVGDFAVDILKSMSGDPKSLRPALKESSKPADVPDISDIEVSQDYVSLVTEGKKIKSNKKVIKESTENRLGNLVERLSSLISEAKGIIQELTSTGNIGAPTNQERNNPWAICHSSTGKSKSNKFERCVTKVKSKLGRK